MTEPGWYADPYSRFEVRYHDGARWTEHVASGGATQLDPAPIEGSGVVQKVVSAVDSPIGREDPEHIQRQVQQRAGLGGTAASGGGTIFTEPILVVNQKAKIIEVTNEYSIYDQHGTQIGWVRQIGQSKARKVLRVLTSVDQYLTHKFAIGDMSGQTLLQLTRPAKVFKSTIVVSDAMGTEIGRIAQENMIGKIRFALKVGEQTLGAVNAENWRAWNFSIQDHTGSEVARITKTWEGMAKAMFTTADNYVVQVHRILEDPLRSLVVAAALGVDTALKQDAQGLG